LYSLASPFASAEIIQYPTDSYYDVVPLGVRCSRGKFQFYDGHVSSDALSSAQEQDCLGCIVLTLSYHFSHASLSYTPIFVFLFSFSFLFRIQLFFLVLSSFSLYFYIFSLFSSIALYSYILIIFYFLESIFF